jgi:hypothetical protein
MAGLHPFRDRARERRHELKNAGSDRTSSQRVMRANERGSGLGRNRPRKRSLRGSAAKGEEAHRGEQSPEAANSSNPMKRLSDKGRLHRSRRYKRAPTIETVCRRRRVLERLSSLRPGKETKDTERGRTRFRGPHLQSHRPLHPRKRSRLWFRHRQMRATLGRRKIQCGRHLSALRRRRRRRNEWRLRFDPMSP